MPLVENRYAEALIKVGVDQVLLDKFEQDLEVIKQGMTESAELKKVLGDPSLKKQMKKQIVEKVFDNAVHKDIMNFVKILIDKGRINLFEGILEQYKTQADELRRCLKIKVITAETITEAQLQKLGEKFKAQYGSNDIKIEHIIDPSILGGVIVRIGDKMVDGSVKGRIDRLSEALA